MKVITLSSLVVLFAIASMVAIAPNAFADHHSATVTNALNSSTPGCEETADGCFIPSTVTIDFGGTVTWENNDTAAHTATGGSATEGLSGVFDSSLIMAGSSFSHTFEDAGSYDYFCMVHPWMSGLVIVEDTDDGCFIPSLVTVDIGAPVTWENNDTAAHTATGGSATEGPSGVFDSSLIMAGSSFSHTFDSA